MNLIEVAANLRVSGMALSRTIALFAVFGSLFLMEVAAHAASGTADIDKSLGWLSDASETIRTVAVHQLGGSKNPLAVPPLIARFNVEPSKSVREDIVTALGQLKGDTAVDGVITALSDKDMKVRATAARTLGELHDPKAVPALVKLLSADDELAIAACKALSTMRSPDAVPALLGTLDSSDPTVKPAVIASLGIIGDQRAVEPLKSLIRNKAWRASAGDALDQIEPSLGAKTVAAVEDAEAKEEAARLAAEKRKADEAEAARLARDNPPVSQSPSAVDRTPSTPSPDDTDDWFSWIKNIVSDWRTWAVVIPVAVVLTYLAALFNSRCPSCKRFWAKTTIGNELIDRGVRYKTVRRTDTIQTPGYNSPTGKPIFQTVQRDEQVAVQTETYRYYHRCKHCTHEWSTTATIDRTG